MAIAGMEQQQELRQKKGWKRAARKRGAGSRRRSSIIEDVVAQVLAGGVPPLQIPGGEQEEEEEEGRSGSCPPPVLRPGANSEVKEMSERRGGENWNEEEMLEEVAPRFCYFMVAFLFQGCQDCPGGGGDHQWDAQSQAGDFF